MIFLRVCGQWSKRIHQVLEKCVLTCVFHALQAGAYRNEEEAAQAHDLAALKYWGTTVYTNFPVLFLWAFYQLLYFWCSLCIQIPECRVLINLSFTT